MKVYMNTPEEVLAMTLAGVQCVCCDKKGAEWPDEVFELSSGLREDILRGHYEHNLRCGLRFYVEAE